MNPPLQLVAVGVDGSPASDAALVYALEEATARRAGVLAVTAWWVGPVLPEHHRDAMRAGRHTAEVLQAGAIARAQAEVDDSPEVLTRLEHGDASAALLEAARRTACLVIGSEHKGLLRRVSEGSVSARVVRNCEVPVVVVPWLSPAALAVRQLDVYLDLDLEAELALDVDRPSFDTLAP